MHPVQKAAQDWQANAIAQCRADPELARQEAAGDLCITCMCSHPCICDWQRTLPEMRAFYEQNRRIERDTFWRGKQVVRAEPVLDMSWGQKGDGLMDGLYKIATARFKAEIGRLNEKLRKRTKTAR